MFFCFFNHQWIRRAVKGQPVGGSGGMLPQRILKSWCSETSFLVFWEDKFCPKCSLNQLSFLCLFLLAWLRVEVVNFILYKLCGFWNCSGYHFQLSILCVVSLYEYHKNSFENFRTTVCQNLKFSYPKRILIGSRDSRAKLEGPRRDQDD